MQKWLKPMRVIVALPFFFLLLFAFVDYSALLPHVVVEIITRLQIVPSVLFLLKWFGAIVVILLFLIILTLLFGRIYCSTICPLGVFQDFISRIAKRYKRKKIYRFSKARNILRYTILGLVVVSLILGSAVLLNLLDPYSNFGKIASDLIRPVYYAANNLIGKLLELVNVYTISQVEFKHGGWLTFVYPAIFLITVVIMASSRGRLFCNTICPVGASLSLLSKVSIFKIKINDAVCTQCGKCSVACKAECIDVKKKYIDFSRCVGCYNCITVCNENGIAYGRPKTIYKPETVQNKDRRAFFGKASMLIVGSAMIGNETISKTIKDNSNSVKKQPVSPPGSLSFNNFNSRCTACHLCISTCPTQVLQPSLFEYGITGMMQPHMDFNQSFCNYECTHCSTVCPTGAIMPLTTERKLTTQIGIAKFVKEDCIVYVKETSCGACAEHCPTAAVHMVPYKGFIKIPEVTPEICVGCGGCEYICPARPIKAINVEGCKEHNVAKKPTIEKNTEKAITDFPF